MGLKSSDFRKLLIRPPGTILRTFSNIASDLGVGYAAMMIPFYPSNIGFSPPDLLRPIRAAPDAKNAERAGGTAIKEKLSEFFVQ
jgi:hypothetical protein